MEKNINELDSFQNELTNLIQKIVEKHESVIKKEDAKQIVQEIIPNLDELISKRIKTHFVEIAQFVLKQYDMKEESK